MEMLTKTRSRRSSFPLHGNAPPCPGRWWWCTISIRRRKRLTPTPDRWAMPEALDQLDELVVSLGSTVSLSRARGAVFRLRSSWSIELLQQRLQPALARQHIPLQPAAVPPNAARHRPDEDEGQGDEHIAVVADGLVVDPIDEEEDGGRTDPPQQHTDQRLADYRRPDVELRDTPVELISKRLAKALLAPRRRPVAHIHRAPREQGGGRADDRKGVIPTGHRFFRPMAVEIDHQRDEQRHSGDHSRAKNVDDPSFSAPLFLQLCLILPQRQVKKGPVHVVQRGRVL